mgnify:FL=1
MSKKFAAIFMAFLVLPFLAMGQACPNGKTDSSCNGECGLYVDGNNNGICDNSEIATSAPEIVSDAPQKAPFEKSPAPAKAAPLGAKTEFVKIWLFSWGMYLLLAAIAKRGKMAPALPNKIFNALLAISFLVCAISSLAFLLKTDFGYNLGLANLYQLHVESGIWLIGLALAHAFWHIPYYLSYFKKG